MRSINDLNLVGTTGSNRRVETKDVAAGNQEIAVRYPRPANGLSTEEKARFASLAAKGLAHLGFTGAASVHSFAQGLFKQAESETAAAKKAKEDACKPQTIVVDGVTYVRQ